MADALDGILPLIQTKCTRTNTEVSVCAAEGNAEVSGAAESSEDESPRRASAQTEETLLAGTPPREEAPEADTSVTEAPAAGAFLTEALVEDSSLTAAPLPDAEPDQVADTILDSGQEEQGELASTGPEFKLNIRLPSTKGLDNICKVPASREWTTQDVKEAVEREAGIPAWEQRLYELGGMVELQNTQTMDLLSPSGSCVELRLERRRPEIARWIDRVEKRGSLFAAARTTVRKDREVALAAVANHGRSLQYVADELKKDKDVVLTAVRNDGYALRFAAPALKHDREVVSAAVTQNGLALAFAGGDLVDDKDLVLTAARNNGLALQFASGSLRGEWQARELAKTTGSIELFTQNVRRKRDHYAYKDDGRWPSCQEWSPRCFLGDTSTTKKSSQNHGKRREARRGAIHGALIFLDAERMKHNGTLRLC